MDNKIDLNEIANRPDHHLTLAPREDPAERDSRLRREELDAVHQRRKELALHVVAFVVIGVALSLCVWVIVRNSSPPDDKKWAELLLTAIVTGLVGYVTGRSTK
jgi:hypothetical protein